MEVEGGSAEKELERRSNFLSSLIKKKKATEQEEQHDRLNVHVRASDMPISLQNRAFACARGNLDSVSGKIDNKSLALALKKVLGGHAYVNTSWDSKREFDTLYGPAWHCIVGTSFGSYVTHSVGGFIYFSIDKVHVLLFRTAVEPMDH